MSHENSETVQNEDGKWINISGNTGEILAPIHAFEATEYNSEPEATAAAEKRSTLFDVVPTSVEESPLTVEEVMALPDAEVETTETTETTETPEESPLTVEEVMALPDAEEPSVSRKVAYGAADEPMIGGSIMRAVETGWEALTEGKSWEQSRADVEAERKEELYTDFPEFRSGQYDADGAVLGGRVVTAAADPATFVLPWTKAVKVGNLVRLSVIGEKTSKTSKVVGAVVSKVPLFTLGATTSAADYSLYSYMRDGNVDSTSLFYVTAAGGTLTIAVEPFAKFLIGKYQKKYGTGVTRDKLNKAESVEEVEKLLGTRAYNLLDTKQKKAMNEVFDFEYMRGLQQTLNRATNMVKERSLAAAEKLKIRKAVKSGKMSKSGAKRQIKQLDIKLNKLDTSVVDKRAKVVQQLAEDIHNNRALTSKVLSYTVRPMIGSSIGAGLGLVAGSDDDAITNMMYWGAALGLAQKGIQANKLLTSSEARAFSRTLHAEQLLLTAQMLKASTALTQVTRLKAGSTIARDFSDKMHHSFSTRGVKPLSVEERAATARNYWDIILRKEVLKQSTKEEQRIAVKNLRGFANKEELTPQIKQLTKDLRTYFDNFTAYNKDVDIKPKELLDNYFPREYSFDVIDAGLTNMLPKGHIAGSVFNGKSFEETVAQIYVRKDKINIKSARKKAAKFIVTLHNPDTSGVTNASNFKLSKVPYVRHLEQKRKLHGTIKIKGKTVQIEELLEPWLKGDIVEILGNMTKESTKAVEFSRTFGKNGVLIYKTLNQVRNHYDDIIAEIDKKTYGGKRKIAQYEFLKNREIKRIKGSVDAFFGVYGQKLDRGYNNAAAVVSLYNSTKMLEDVAVANLGDLVQPFIQGAKLKDVLKAWRNSSFKATTTDLRSEVEPGHIINMLGQDTLAAEARATAGILEDTGGIVRKWSDGFYRVTQLNNITSYARRFAFNVGAQDLFTIAKTNARNRAKVIRDTEIKHNVKWFDLTEAKQRQYLKEHPKAYDNQRLIEEGQYYGVSTKEMLAISKFDTFKEAYADKNLRALFESAGFRAMERDAKIPNVGNRLLFTQSRHPIMRLLGQFTSWAQAHSAKTNAMIKKIEDGNTKQAVRMIASLAVFHQIRQLRDIIKNGETDDDLTIPQHIARAAELSGAPGVWAGYYGSTLRATEGDYDFNPLTSFPAGRSTIDIWKQYEKEDNFADLIDQFQETGMSNGDAWNLLEDHYERVLPLPKLRGLIDEVFDNDEAAGFSKGGLVSQAERLGFNKGGAVSQEDITAVTDEWSKTPSDIGNAWKKRATSMQTTMQGARDSEIKPLQYAWNTASDIAGGVWDTGEEILEPVIDTVQLGAKATFPDAYAATAEALTDAGKQILDSDIGKKGLETAKDIYEWFQGFKKENPHDAKSIEGIGNLFPISIGAKAVNKTLKNQMDTLNTKSTYQYKPNSDTPYLDMDNEKINKVNKFFNPDVINKALQSKDKNTKVVYMTPGEFLTLAKTHTSDGETKKLDRINNAINEGIQLEDIPTLTIKAGKDGNSQVTKHDGRHRANALYELGEDLIPVRVKTTGNKDNKKLSTVTNEDGLEVYTFPAYSSLIYDRHHLGTVESYDTKKPKAAMPAKKTKEVRDNEFKELAKGLTESGGFKYKLPTMLLDLALKDKVGLSKPKQWKYSLSQWAKKGKIKQEELDDSMLMKWLDTIDVDGKLSTKDIFNFMRDNSPMLKTYTSKIQSKVDTEWLDKQPLQQEKIKLQDNAHNKFQEVIYLRDLSNITDISSDNKKLVKTTAEMMHHAIVENIINYMHSPSFIDNQLMDFLTNSPYTLKAIQRKAVDANLLNKPNSIFHPDHQQLDNKEYIREAAVELVSEVTPDKRNSYIVGAIIEDLNQAYLKAEGREKEVLSKYVNIFMDSYKAKIKQIRFGIENVTELRKLSEEALRRNAGDVNPSTWSSFSLPNMKGKPVTILVQSKVGTDDRLKKLRDFRAEVSEHSKGPYIGHSSELSITGLTTKLNDPTTLPLSAKERIETVRKLKRSKQTFKEKTGVTWEDRQTYLDNLEGNIYTEEHWTGTYGESPLKKGIPQENIIISIRGNVIEQGSLGESRGLFISEQQAQPHQTAMANKKQLDVLGNNLFKNITGYSALDSGAKIKELQRKLKSSEARKRAISGKYRKLQKDYSERYEELEGQARASILAEVKRDGYELTEQELATEVAIRVWRVVDNNYNMYDPKLKSINNQQEYNIKVTSKLNAQEADIAIQIRQLTNSLGTMVNALPENLSHKKDWTPLAMKQSIKYAIDNNLNYLVLPIEKHSIQQIEQWGDREPAVLTAILDRNSIYSPRAYRDIVKKWDKDAKPFNDEYLDRDKQGDWDENDIHKVIVLPITDAIRAGYKKDGLTAYRRGGLVTQMKALIPNG